MRTKLAWTKLLACNKALTPVISILLVYYANLPASVLAKNLMSSKFII